MGLFICNPHAHRGAIDANVLPSVAGHVTNFWSFDRSHQLVRSAFPAEVAFCGQK